MDYKYIEQLLDRYFQCETSLEEESILRTFFAQNDVPANLQSYQQLFLCQQEMADEKLSDGFDERILSLIEGQTDDHKVVKAKTVRMSYRFRPFFKAAAMVAVVLSFSLAVQQAMYRSQPDTPSSTTLAPQVVPVAGETAFGGKDGETTLPDSLVKLQNSATSQAETLQP